MEFLIFIILVVLYLNIFKREKFNKVIDSTLDTLIETTEIALEETKRIRDETIRENKQRILDKEQEVKKSDSDLLVISPINLEEIYKNLEDLDSDIFALSSKTNKVKKDSTLTLETTLENHSYIKKLSSISNISFEKIRRYYNNLVKDNTADIMAKEFSEQAKLYKALIYDALEQFMYDLTCDELSIIDWGCSQGMGSALVLDYIKEKQLNIKVTQVILIDDDKKALSRAKLHVDVLKQNELEIITIDVNEGIEKLNEVKNGFSLNLFVNEKDIVDLRKVEFDKFVDDYFICIAHKNASIINAIYTKVNSWKFIILKVLTDRKTKVGRFEKNEKIFQVTGIIPIPMIIEIDNNGLQL